MLERPIVHCIIEPAALHNFCEELVRLVRLNLSFISGDTFMRHCHSTMMVCSIHYLTIEQYYAISL